jgi:hypothetical protein
VVIKSQSYEGNAAAAITPPMSIVTCTYLYYPINFAIRLAAAYLL